MNIDFSRWKWWLKVLATPSCWHQLYSYSEAWDRKLRDLMETEDFTDVGRHTARIGGYLVWTSNHPYASFRLYPSPSDIRPSRATILQAREKWQKDLVENREKDYV